MNHLFHPDSKPCCLSELDLFSVPETQTDINESSYVAINPVTAITNNDAPIEFLVPSAGDLFYDLSSCYIYIKAQIKLNTDENLAPEMGVAPENNIGHTMFESCQIYLNESSVTATANYYYMRAFLENLFNFSQDGKKTYLYGTCGFYTPDEKNTYTSKFVSKAKPTFETITRIHSDMFLQPRLLLNGVDIKIKFTRNPHALCLNVTGQLPDNKHPIIHILDTYIYVKRVKLTAHKQLEIERRLNAHPSKYPLTRTDIKLYTIGNGLSSKEITNMVIGSLPKRVIVGFIDHDTVSGSYKKSIFKFLNSDIKKLALYSNGIAVGKPFETDYSGGNAINLALRPYHSLFSATDNLNELGHGISYSDFVKHYNLYCFDLSQDGCADAKGYVNPISQGNLSLTVEFGYALQQPLTAVVYMEFTNLLEIDKSRNVVHNF